jgi:hypothetical protein
MSCGGVGSGTGPRIVGIPGWERLKNGDLLDTAEAGNCDLLITADKGFLHQQSLRDRRLAIVVLDRGNWPHGKANVWGIIEAVGTAQSGTCSLVRFLL